jgi:hypothetical protein
MPHIKITDPNSKLRGHIFETIKLTDEGAMVKISGTMYYYEKDEYEVVHVQTEKERQAQQIIDIKPVRKKFLGLF